MRVLRSPFVHLALAVALLTGCGAEGPPSAAGPAGEADPGRTSAAERAAELARALVLVDTHVDTPYRWREHGPMDLLAGTGGDFDIPRARHGGLDAAFMSIYVPASYQESGGARELADELIDLVASWAARWPDHVELVTSPAEVQRAAERGRIGLALGMENGAPVAGDLALVEHFRDRGIRYITLTHSENNALADSSYADEPRWNGLSEEGRRVVAEMNRLGMMVDVSHVTDAAARQVLEVSHAPVIASHSSCRAFTPGWERNMGDELLVALAAAGGVLQINFGSSFLLAEAQRQSEEAWGAVREYVDEHGLDAHSEEARAFRDGYWREHERIYADVSDVADHIDHAVALVGVDHVGLGSDFDGVGDSLPVGLKDVAGYPNLLAELLARGYTEEELAKIAGGNLLRVWAEVERVAAELATEPAAVASGGAR